MPPFVDKQPIHTEDPFEKLVAPQAAPWKYEILYPAVLGIGYAHLAAIYGLYLAVTAAQWYTLVFSAFTAVTAGIGITAGTHRLWAHRAYKAKPPLQILLMIMQSMAFQYSAITWTKLHRTHHRSPDHSMVRVPTKLLSTLEVEEFWPTGVVYRRFRGRLNEARITSPPKKTTRYSDTDADPHNATRGFFFSHIGFLLVKSHPEFRKRIRLIDLSDLYSNRILMLQHKYTTLFCFTFCLLLPTVIPVYLWGESLSVAWHVTLLRYIYNLHATFLVNSAAHLWGNKPYDQYIKPVQNPFVSFVTYGEGFHNYHHVFPWDYRTAELGNNWLNLTTLFIDFFAWVGWAYDLKTVPDDVISARAERTGDGTNKIWGLHTKSS